MPMANGSPAIPTNAWRRVEGSRASAPSIAPLAEEKPTSEFMARNLLGGAIVCWSKVNHFRNTISLISVISSMAKRMPSRPKPESFRPPYGMLSTRKLGMSLIMTPPTSSSLKA
jgi:hypothetical protein